MDEKTLRKLLSDLPLGDVRYFAQTGSTNDVALARASDGAPDMSVICADEQTTGRGRMGRKWFTPPGAALACSLILRPKGRESENIGLFSGLGALALVGALKKYGIGARVKWPNDVLINGRKTAGILAETVWMGAEVDSLVLGMGVNVDPESVPPPGALNFPATCVQSEAPAPVERFELLHDLLAELIAWRPKLASGEFLRSWEETLAFRGQTVRVQMGEAQEIVGQVLGLETDGSLRLVLNKGEIKAVHFGEVQLRPLLYT
jgi:BirA family transcriptional regulator, biotin operon repressor / biotin---[acetyl-CoA-carboxylase] ligase